jgi:hypothetical protein
LNELSTRTQRLHGLFDSQVGLTLTAQAQIVEGDGEIVTGLN